MIKGRVKRTRRVTVAKVMGEQRMKVEIYEEPWPETGLRLTDENTAPKLVSTTYRTVTQETIGRNGRRSPNWCRNNVETTRSRLPQFLASYQAGAPVFPRSDSPMKRPTALPPLERPIAVPPV